MFEQALDESTTDLGPDHQLILSRLHAFAQTLKAKRFAQFPHIETGVAPELGYVEDYYRYAPFVRHHGDIYRLFYFDVPSVGFPVCVQTSEDGVSFCRTIEELDGAIVTHIKSKPFRYLVAALVALEDPVPKSSGAEYYVSPRPPRPAP